MSLFRVLVQEGSYLVIPLLCFEHHLSTNFLTNQLLKMSMSSWNSVCKQLETFVQIPSVLDHLTYDVVTLIHSVHVDGIWSDSWLLHLDDLTLILDLHG